MNRTCRFVPLPMTVLAVFAILVITAHASAQNVHMVAELESQNRQCMRDLPGSNGATRASGVAVNGASNYERDLVNRAIAKMNSMARGGRLSALNGLRIDFMDYLPRATGCVPAAQTKGYVEVGRRCPPGYGTYNFIGDTGVGLLIHEIGHHVGNRGGYNGYPVGCHISGYCTHTSAGNTHSANTQRNEEFAEVFAAYVLQPNLLRKTNGCANAYRHMRSLFGGPPPGPTCRTPKPAATPAPGPVPLPRPRPATAPGTRPTQPATITSPGQIDPVPLPRPRPQNAMAVIGEIYAESMKPEPLIENCGDSPTP